MENKNSNVWNTMLIFEFIPRSILKIEERKFDGM